MQEQENRNRHRFWHGFLYVLIAIFSFILAGDLHHNGIAPKWGTAIAGTITTFGVVVYLFRSHFGRLAFWFSFLTCFLVHVGLMWIIFRFALEGFTHFSPLLWYPFMLIEILVLMVVIKRIEEKITGKHEIITVD
jgi:hypothetical protein